MHFEGCDTSDWLPRVGGTAWLQPTVTKVENKHHWEIDVFFYRLAGHELNRDDTARLSEFSAKGIFRYLQAQPSFLCFRRQNMVAWYKHADKNKSILLQVLTNDVTVVHIQTQQVAIQLFKRLLFSVWVISQYEAFSNTKNFILIHVSFLAWWYRYRLILKAEISLL